MSWPMSALMADYATPEKEPTYPLCTQIRLRTKMQQLDDGSTDHTSWRLCRYAYAEDTEQQKATSGTLTPVKQAIRRSDDMGTRK